MGAFLPPAAFVIAWALAAFGVEPPGASSTPPFEETLLLWTLYLGAGWTGVGAGLSHTLFAKQTAASIGWETNGFQYEVGFANIAIGLAAIYAVHSGTAEAWVAASIASGTFLLLAAANHVREMVSERNFAPGNSVILLSDIGVPATLFATLLATNSI